LIDQSNQKGPQIRGLLFYAFHRFSTRVKSRLWTATAAAKRRDAHSKAL